MGVVCEIIDAKTMTKSMLAASAIIVTVLGAAVLGAPQAYAAPAATNVTGNAEEGDYTKKTSFSFGSCGNTDVGINCLVVEVMKFASGLVGVAVVGGIIVGGIVYSTSEGNPGKAQKGVTIITNSVLGLLLYLLMFAIINFLIPGGILT